MTNVTTNVNKTLFALTVDGQATVVLNEEDALTVEVFLTNTLNSHSAFQEELILSTEPFDAESDIFPDTTIPLLGWTLTIDELELLQVHLFTALTGYDLVAAYYKAQRGAEEMLNELRQEWAANGIK